MITDPPPPGASDVPGRRESILQMLRNSTEPRSIASLAAELGVHANTVRFHLETLVQAGRVEQLRGAPARTGRPPTLFRASRRMDPAGPTSYRLLATVLAGYLAASSRDTAATATELGRSWGSSFIQRRWPGRMPARSRSVIELVAILDELGFKPEPPPTRNFAEIRLRHCPFHDLAREYGQVICSIHLGLMQGVLSELRGSVTVDRLEPFVEPDLCIAHLDRHPPSGRA
jgi:predicted ArsR family transcriptional regulator